MNTHPNTSKHHPSIHYFGPGCWLVNSAILVSNYAKFNLLNWIAKAGAVIPSKVHLFLPLFRVNLFTLIVHIGTSNGEFTKNENDLIIYSPTCHSKPVWLFLLWNTKEDILKNVSAAFVHIVKVNVSQNNQAPKMDWRIAGCWSKNAFKINLKVKYVMLTASCWHG